MTSHGSAYITGTSSFLPNAPVANDDIEQVLGMIGGKPSRARRIVLRNNGIRSRHYAIDPATGAFTHSNAQLAAAALRGLDLANVEVLACGTSCADQLMPGHTVMVHGELGIPPCEVVSTAGICAAGMGALKYAQSLGQTHSLSICNVLESALPRESELVLYTRAGAEIGVASTKAFTTQLVVLFGLAVTLGKMRGHVGEEQARAYTEELRQLPGSIQHVMNLEPQIAAWAQKFAKKASALFLGRGIHYPIALEGALKLKEITYIHAEAYPAGELKHGPLALVDENMPVVVIAPNDSLLDKVKANMQEVGARGGELFVFTDLDSNFHESEGVHVIRTPRHAGVLSPIVHTIPVQLLSYHAALARGTDVDKPRNLAKSVTVE